MQIQPQFQTVGYLLTGRLFHIPEYQRAYSWQTRQRGDLFEDIKKVHSSGNDSTHFMATIVGPQGEIRQFGIVAEFALRSTSSDALSL